MHRRPAPRWRGLRQGQHLHTAFNQTRTEVDNASEHFAHRTEFGVLDFMPEKSIKDACEILVEDDYDKVSSFLRRAKFCVRTVMADLIRSLRGKVQPRSVHFEELKKLAFEQAAKLRGEFETLVDMNDDRILRLYDHVAPANEQEVNELVEAYQSLPSQVHEAVFKDGQGHAMDGRRLETPMTKHLADMSTAQPAQSARACSDRGLCT